MNNKTLSIFQNMWYAGSLIKRGGEGIVACINRVAKESQITEMKQQSITIISPTLEPLRLLTVNGIPLTDIINFDKRRASKSRNQNPNSFADFKAGKYKDRHPVTLELLDDE